MADNSTDNKFPVANGGSGAPHRHRHTSRHTRRQPHTHKHTHTHTCNHTGTHTKADTHRQPQRHTHATKKAHRGTHIHFWHWQVPACSLPADRPAISWPGGHRDTSACDLSSGLLPFPFLPVFFTKDGDAMPFWREAGAAAAAAAGAGAGAEAASMNDQSMYVCMYAIASAWLAQ